MIIRVLTEGQYEVRGETLAELDRCDNDLLEAVANNDAQAFARSLAVVIDVVRKGGRKLADDELKESDLVLPAPDMTLDEARELFIEYPKDLVQA